MRLSTTARFLIAALLLAAAAFVWVNFFDQNRLSDTPTLAGTAQPGAITVADPTSDAEATAEGTADGEALAVVGDADEQAPSEAAATGDPADGPAVVSTDAPSPSSPPVVVAEQAQVVTRDLVVDELPFLVLAPPAPGASDADPQGAAASRPQGTQRASINPFSPVVVRTPAAPPVQQVAEAEPPASTPVVEVRADAAPPASQPVRTATQAPPEPVRAPAPRTVAPASAVASDLPRALPTGMLPTAPQILLGARSQPAVVEPIAPNIGDLAALREPGEEATVQVTPVTTAEAAPESALSVPDPLGPGRPLSQPAAATTPATPALPLAVGADPLSRYLRDNDVRFTGTVLGPLSVGVFRSNLYSSPVVLTLGQNLPDTDILLSDLRGYEARFSQGDRTQTLSLDLRR